MSQSRWTAADLPSQAGRTFLITGANSGIGFPTARALAEKGAHVVLAVRDVAKGEAAAESISGDWVIVRFANLILPTSPRYAGSPTDGRASSAC